jgi:DNA-directed RNA polymerase specialized sigma24 family protein
MREPNAFHARVHRIASRQAFRALKANRRLVDCRETDLLWEAVAPEAPDEKLAPELIERIPALLEQATPASRVVLMASGIGVLQAQNPGDR